MRRISRDTWLALGVVVLLLASTIAAAVQQARAQIRQSAPPLSSFSTAPEGTAALWSWLDELGYTVSNEVDVGFAIPAGTRLVWLLEPTREITADDWMVLEHWVQQGGTLVLAGEGWTTAFALRHFDLGRSYLDDRVVELTVQTPLLAAPAAPTPPTARAIAYLRSSRADSIVLLAVDAGPVMVAFPQGAGWMVVSAATFPFSNAGLKEPGNRELVLNLIGMAGRSGGVWFDEWHHGLRGRQQEVTGPEEWLRYTTAGNALLLGAGIVFLALLLRGRRFGRPVPLARSLVRRAPLEYINAIANLTRRAGHRTAVLQRYHLWLKRELGKRYHLDPTVPDEEYVTRLAAYDPDLDAVALRSLLARLARGRANEGEAVQWVAEVNAWLRKR